MHPVMALRRMDIDMATLTLRIPASAAMEATAPVRRGFWRRLFDAMVEARMRQAQAEIAHRRHLLPTDPVAEAGYRVGLKDVGNLPFVR